MPAITSTSLHNRLGHPQALTPPSWVTAPFPPSEVCSRAQASPSTRCTPCPCKMNLCLVLRTKYPLFILSANLPNAVVFATGLTPNCLSQIDLFEINEAFAGQCVRSNAACKLQYSFAREASRDCVAGIWLARRTLASTAPDAT